VSEALTAFLSIENPLHDETEAAIEAAFDDLEVSLGGIGELVGWDADADRVELRLVADEPERVIALLVETLRTVDVQPPSRLVASDPANGTKLYERNLA
jgi:hypothetical protein